MIKKRYELVQNGICHDYFDKCREGLSQAYQTAEQMLAESREDIWQLEIYCVSYDGYGKVITCELVDEWETEEGYIDQDIDESMDGDFDSAMTSAGFGTDEDYGYFGD